VPDPVVATLRAHRGRQLAERMLAGGAWTDTGLVFTTELGTPIDPSNLRRAFQRLTNHAGLGRWTPNELRHSAASLLSAAGVPLEVIADVLGHSSTRMLQQHYRHPVKPAIDAHVEAMHRLFAAP
jgi:integrase